MNISNRRMQIAKMAMLFFIALTYYFFLTKVGITNTFFWKFFVGIGIAILIVCLEDIYVFYIAVAALPFPLYFKGFSLGNLLIFVAFMKSFIAEKILNRSQYRFIPSTPLNIPILILFMIYTISLYEPFFHPLAMKGGYPYSAFGSALRGYWDLIGALCFFFLAVKFLDTQDKIEKVFQLLLLGGIFNVILIVLNYSNPGMVGRLPGFLGGQLAETGIGYWTGFAQTMRRFGGTLRDYELMGEFFVVVSILNLYFIFNRLHINKKIVYIILSMLFLYGLFSTGTRGAYVSFLGGLICYYFITLKIRSAVKRFGILLGIIFLFFLAGYLARDLFKLGFLLDLLPSMKFYGIVPDTRRFAWSIWASWYPRIPLTGFGPVEGGGISGYISPHSLYLDFLFKFNWLGLIMLLTVIIYILIKGFLFIRRNDISHLHLLVFVYATFFAVVVDQLKVEYSRVYTCQNYFWLLAAVIIVYITSPEKTKGRLLEQDASSSYISR